MEIMVDRGGRDFSSVIIRPQDPQTGWTADSTSTGFTGAPHGQRHVSPPGVGGGAAGALAAFPGPAVGAPAGSDVKTGVTLGRPSSSCPAWT